MDQNKNVDDALDQILRASGSALKYYTTPLTIEKMREAMRSIMSELYVAGANDNYRAMKAAGKIND